MFSVEEVAEQLRVSKVTIYSKLKKFNSKVVLMDGKKYITEELLILIRNDLKIKDRLNEELNYDEGDSLENKDISGNEDEITKLNSKLIKSLMNQLEEKDKQIDKLHKLIENNQVLLKQQQYKEIKQLQLEEHFRDVDEKLIDLKERLEYRRKPGKRRFIKVFFKKSEKV